MKGFINLLSFMTRLPVPNIEYDEQKMGKAMKFFPFVGFIIGILLYFTAFIMLRITLSFELTIAFVILVEIILTGGIHLDGLADTFDGIFSYRSKQKMLEIMKDSRLGTNGAIALIMYFLLKYLLIFIIMKHFGMDYMLYTIFTYPIVGRLCSVVSCASAPYARASGMAKTFIDNTNFVSVIIATISTFILAQLPLFDIFKDSFYPIIAVSYLIIMAVLMLVSFLFSKLMIRKIGGITGDTLGALLELSQLLYLFLLTVIASFKY